MKEEEIFHKALEQPSKQRVRYLDEACGDDAALRRRVELLLQANANPGSFLGQPVAAAATIDMPSVTEKPGTQIGPYRLREQIGEGGFGVVYVAQQSKPVRRKVALKIIKPGMDTKDVIARFEAERQALALMDHPNIAKVLDAGATESGRPYFVMELVRGVPITEFCDEQDFSTRARLMLFIDICRAVQHAHHKGIIHRDLKPSNIMVTLDDNRPIPKVIDFGISKALTQQLTENSVYTTYGQMVGTPLYMAPEQAQMSMRDVDTRSDVYSLGVLLYELLTGTTPFDKETLQNAGFEELRRIIREDEPPRPSARISTLNVEALSTVSDRRRIDSRKLSQSLRGELDWIVMKALEKDRNRRYESASAFAADVERYLGDEVVQARPPSLAYRLQKLVRRNKSVLVVTVCIAFSLSLAAGSIGWSVRNRSAIAEEQARQREDLAREKRRDEATRRAAWRRDIVAALRTSEHQYANGNVSEALAAAKRAVGLLSDGTADEELRSRVERQLRNLEMALRVADIGIGRMVMLIEEPGPKVEIDTTATIALSHREVADNRQADRDYAVAFRKFGVDVDKLPTEDSLHQLHDSDIRVELAAALDRWAVLRREYPVKDGITWQELLKLARRLDPDEHRCRFRDAWERSDKKRLASMANSGPPANLATLNVQLLALALDQTNATEQAVQLLRKALRKRPDDFSINYLLSCYLVRLRPPQSAEALRFATTAVALRNDSAAAQYHLGSLLRREKRLQEAIVAFRHAVQLRPDEPWGHYWLGDLLERHSQFKGAEVELRKCIAMRSDNSMYQALFSLIRIYSRRSRLGELEEEYRRLVKREPQNSQAHHMLGIILNGSQFAEAEASFREAIRCKPNDHLHHWRLAVTLNAQEKWAEAEAAFRDCVRLTPDDWPVAQYNACSGLAHALSRQRKYAEAEPVIHSMIQLCTADKLQDSLSGEAYLRLGSNLFNQKKYAGAEDVLRKLIALKIKGWSEFSALQMLAIVLERQRKWAEAETAYRELLRMRPDSPQSRSLSIVITQQGKTDPDPELEFFLRRGIQAHPNDEYLPFLLGSHLILWGRLGDAEKVYREARRRRPKEKALYLHNLAIVLAGQEKWAPAKAAWEELLGSSPAHLMRAAPTMLDSFAWMLATCRDPRYRDPKRAISLAKRATELAPDFGPYWTTLAAAHYSAGDGPAALLALAQAEGTRSGVGYRQPILRALVQSQLGYRVFARRSYNQGIKLLEERSLSTKYASIRDLRVEAAVLMGIDGEGPAPIDRKAVRPERLRFNKAVSDSVRKAISMQPDNPRLHRFLAKILERQKKPEEARAELLKAEELERREANEQQKRTVPGTEVPGMSSGNSDESKTKNGR